MPTFPNKLKRDNSRSLLHFTVCLVFGTGYLEWAVSKGNQKFHPMTTKAGAETILKRKTNFYRESLTHVMKLDGLEERSRS